MSMLDGHEAYSSGGNVRIVTTDDRTASFNTEDFRKRLELAARRLRVVSTPLEPAELDDLVAFASEQAVEEPASPLGEHLNRYRRVFLTNEKHNFSTWLRGVVFRDADLETRVKLGQLSTEFNEQTGDYDYRDVRSGQPFEPISLPSWEDVAYHRPMDFLAE